MRQLPQLTYSGLTIIMSNPSRFDLAEKKLLSATAGWIFNNECLHPYCNRYQCDIRLTDCKEPLIAGTKAVLLLGDRAMKDWLPPEIVKQNTIHELRGSGYMINGICHLASYSLQDCIDVQNWEKTHNPELVRLASELEDSSNKTDTTGQGEKRRHSPTSRNNFRFFLRKDTQKLLKLVKEQNGVIPYKDDTKYVIYPSAAETIKLLSETKDKLLFFDMETTYETHRITCFAFGFSLDTVYVVPVVCYDYSGAYNELTLAKIFRALAIAIRDNTIVAHNGAGFDFFILAKNYKIPIGRRVYDTMIAQHRIYPEIEKSLGHCVSLHTWEPYHKDESFFAFGSQDQWMKNLQYCGKDVATMIRVYEAQQAHAKTIPGLIDSIQQANDSIRPYLITQLLGMEYDLPKTVEILTENDRLLTQYLRAINILIGEKAKRQIMPKSKTAVACMPTSNSQCTGYFHDLMNYPVIYRSKKTGKPSLAEKHMLKLRLKIENPVIDLCLAFRQLAKESSSLKFNPINW